jgi:hypothetical protein
MTPNSYLDDIYKWGEFAPLVIQEEYLKNVLSSPVLPKLFKTYLEGFQLFDFARSQGSCFVLFSTEAQILSRFPYLRSSFALPFLWKKDTHDCLSLPPSLKRIARRICKQICPTENWGLHWDAQREVESPFSWDLSWDLPCDSGWASLSASLILVKEGGVCRSGIWSSAAWDESGILSVQDLEKKIETLYDFKAETLFVPEQNKESAQEFSSKIASKRNCPPLTIEILRLGISDWKEVLKPYLSVLEHPPDRSHPLEKRCAYMMRQEERNKEAGYRYYLENLVEDLAEIYRKQEILHLSSQARGKIENLISFLSLNTGALLSLFVLNPKRLLCFYTEESFKDLAKLQEITKKKNIELEAVKLDFYKAIPDEDEILYQKIQAFVEKYGSEKTAIDITPGTKNFSVIASWAVNPQITPCLYLGQVWTNRRLVPGKERIRRLLPPS